MKNCLNKEFNFKDCTIEVKKTITLFLTLVLFNLSVYSQSPVANFTASTTEGCAPLQVSFTNNSTNAISYQWTFGDGNSSTILDPSNIFMSPGNFEIKLVAQNSTGQIDSFFVTIAVNPKPIASFSVSSTSACVNNNQFTFTNNSTGADTYLWDFGDGNVSTSHSPTHTYNLPGSYSIKLITNNNFGCTDITEKINHITIHPKPDPDFTVNKNYACDTTHTFHFIPTQSNMIYLWNFGDGNTSTLNSPTHNYSGQGIYNISLITENNFGCKDTVVKNAFVQVGSTILAIVSANQTFGCPPLDVTMSASTPGMTMTNYDFGSGMQSSSSHVYNTSGSYNVTVEQIDNKGCSHITTFNNYFNVYPSPQVSFTTFDTSGCSPYNVQLTNTTTNAVTYNWDFGDGSPISTSVNPLHTYYDDGSYNITLEAVSSNGCVGTYTFPAKILVNSPIADITSNIKNGCAPLTVDFYNNSTNGVQFFWDFGDGTTSTIANPIKTYLNAGNYSVTLGIMSSNGCVDTIVYNNYIQVLNPYSAYNAPTVKSGCSPFTVSFTDNTSGNSSVVWDFGDGTTSNATNPVKTYTTPGIYTVSLTVQTINGCTFNILNYQTIEVLGAKAHFSVNYISCPPYIASFIDSSVNAVSWLWNFGDGNTSTQQNPTHTYGGYGTYNVSLTITTSDGCSHTQMIVNAVVFEQLSANFSWTSSNTGFPMTVNFMANSTGATNWLWDFGDGGTSSLENPIYTYQTAGQYSVTLIVSNNNCSITYTMSPTTFGSGAGGMDPGPGPGPQPVVISGCAPFTTQFNDPTLNSTVWLWIFGDGNTSNLQNPTHTYFNPGIYDITLITSKSSSSGDIQDTITLQNVIVSGPVAAFSVITNTDCQSTVAQITDQSVNAIQWNWNFGDGNNSTQQNPTHTYQSMLNNYSISLTATDSVGCTNQTFQNINSGTSQIISASKYKLCKGDTVYFTTNLTGYSFYIWDFGDGNISFNQQASHIYNNHGNYQVSLIVYSNSGCTFTHYLPVNISVNGPIANFNVSGDTQSCKNLIIQFENFSNNSTSYYWNFGNGLSSTQFEPKQLFGPGVYDIMLIASSNGCNDTIIKPEYIKITNLQVDFSFTQSDKCSPSVVQFTDLSTNAVTWNWDFGDGYTSQLQNPTHTLHYPLNWPFTLTVTDSMGCSRTKIAGPVYFMTGSFIASQYTGCAPLTVDFTSTLQNVASVEWHFGDGNTSTSLNPTHTYTNAGSYDVNLIIYSAGGCSDTITQKGLISVNKPAASFSHVISSNCIPAIVDFTNTSQNAVSYLWDFGDGTFSSSQDPSKVYNSPGKYTVTLIATNENGCKDTLEMISLIGVSGPVTNFSINISSICSPVVSLFTDLSLNTVSWIWNFGDGNSDSTQNPSHIYSDTGIFSVTLIATDTAGCSAAYSMPAAIEVRPTPEAGLITNDTIGCTPFISGFTNSSTNADTYIWTFGDGNTSTLTHPNHTYYQSGLYNIRLIASNQYGCADTLIIEELIDVVETPDAEFSSDVINGCSPLLVQFNDLSTGLQNPAWSWNFNNGNYSSVQNPDQTFVTPGGYTISLVVTNQGRCSDSISKPSFIIVNDLIPPAQSPIFSVSVKSSTEVEITYGYVMDLDLSAYNLYRKNLVTGNFDLINTQYNPNSTSFSWDTTIVDYNLMTTNNIYTYKIQTIDICGNTIDINDIPEYNTINLSTSIQTSGVKLNWNPYGGCSIDNYNIYRYKSNQAPQLIATVPPGVLEYIDMEILCPEMYVYIIEATDLCNLPFASWSDTSRSSVPNLLMDQKVEVVRSTVIDNQNVLTEWNIPVLAPDKVSNYNIYRSENNNNYQLIATLPALATDFVDYNTDVELNRYIYSVEVINICNLSGSPSNIGNSILLKARTEDHKMILDWNGYVGWPDGVKEYKVEKMDAYGNWKEMGIVDGDSRQFVD